MINQEWRKATSSGENGGECVELNVRTPGLIRDSKNPNGPALKFTSGHLTAFFAKIKSGELDR